MNRFAPSLSIYLGRQFLASLAGVVTVFLGLIVLFDTIELWRRTVRVEDAGLSTVFGLALLKAPHMIQDTLPFAVMIAVMFALFRLARNYELVIIRSAGVSAWQVLSPVMGLTVVLGLLNLALLNPFAASLYAMHERMMTGLTNANAATLNIGDTGFWLRETVDDEAVIVHARSVHQDAESLLLSGITILRLNSKNELVHRIEAPAGQLRGDEFQLENSWDMEPGKLAVSQPRLTQKTTITLAQIQNSFADPETLSIWDLPEFIDFSQAAGFSALPHRLYLQSLMALPLLLCAMVLLAASFFLTTQARMAEWTIRSAAGVAAGFIVFFFTQVTFALGLAGTLPLALAAWAPAVIASLFGLTYLFYREDG